MENQTMRNTPNFSVLCSCIISFHHLACQGRRRPSVFSFVQQKKRGNMNKSIYFIVVIGLLAVNPIQSISQTAPSPSIEWKAVEASNVYDAVAYGNTLVCIGANGLEARSIKDTSVLWKKLFSEPTLILGIHHNENLLALTTYSCTDKEKKRKSSLIVYDIASGSEIATQTSMNTVYTGNICVTPTTLYAHMITLREWPTNEELVNEKESFDTYQDIFAIYNMPDLKKRALKPGFDKTTNFWGEAGGFLLATVHNDESNNRLAAIDPKSGEVAWEYKSDDRIVGGQIEGDTIYLRPFKRGKEKVNYASIRLRDGKGLWRENSYVTGHATAYSRDKIVDLGKQVAGELWLNVYSKAEGDHLGMAVVMKFSMGEWLGLITSSGLFGIIKLPAFLLSAFDISVAAFAKPLELNAAGRLLVQEDTVYAVAVKGDEAVIARYTLTNSDPQQIWKKELPASFQPIGFLQQVVDNKPIILTATQLGFVNETDGSVGWTEIPRAGSKLKTVFQNGRDMILVYSDRLVYGSVQDN
jgi:outer membrane protein assembly factor BamB